MDKAYRLLAPGEAGAYSDRVMVDEKWLYTVDRNQARKYKYICVQEGCGIPVFPVYPEKAPAGRKVPVRHFAPRGAKHINHGKSAGSTSTGDGGLAASTASDIPTHWRPRVHSTGSSRKPGSLSGDGGSVDITPKRERGHRGEAGQQVTTGRLLKLVQAWREHQPHIRSFDLQGFPSGKERWDNVFRPIDESTSTSKGQRIWFGTIREVKAYGQHHFKIFFKSTTRDGLSTSCYFDFQHEEQKLHPEFVALLLSAAEKQNVTAYALGNLGRLGNNCQIEVEDFRSLVILEKDNT